MKDINQNYFNVKEYNNFRAFLYSPADDFLGEVELIRPRLSLKTVGFGVLDFELPEFYFNDSPVNDGDPDNDYGDLEFNEKIYSVLDGYEIEVWFGNLILNDVSKFKKIRFKIQNRPRAMAEEKTNYSYRGLTNEIELSKVPIIDWPGIKIEQYKQVSSTFNSEAVSNNSSEPYLQSISFLNNPVVDTELIYRVNTQYGVEEPLRAANVNNPNLMGEEEYLIYEDSGTWKVWVWVPANMSIPTDEFGSSVIWTEDSYNYSLYFETEDTTINSSLEPSPYYLKNGLGIEEILKDLFNNVNPNFINWSLGSITEAAKEEVRSQLSFSNTNVYEVISSLAENYQLYMDFDTINREINVMKLKEFGEDRGLRLEYGKYIKGINQEFTTDNMINYIQGSDADSVGFADVSWTNDNYTEDYSYYLSDAIWNGSELVGSSNWLSTELTTEIAKTNYYKNLFNDEVWGSSSLSGIANIKKDLQEKVSKKENELVELKQDVELIEGVIESYKNESPEQQQVLDEKAVSAAYTVQEITPARTYEFSNLNTSTSVNNLVFSINNLTSYYFIESEEKFFNSGLVKSLKVEGENFESKFQFASLLRVKLYNQGVLQKTVNFSMGSLGEIIALPEFITADSFIASVIVLTKDSTKTVQTSINSITVYTAEDTNLIQSWNNYLEYQNQELLDAKSRVKIKENEIGKLKYGVGDLFDYDTTQAFDESLIDYENDNYYGLFQIEKRIKYITDNFTKIDFNSLTQKAKEELKKIRKGAIYQNSNISDSTTLLKAAKEELLNRNYPEVTLDIETINILKASEAYGDWHKAALGERVFVYVPRIGVEVAAQIQELNIDFESFSMGVKISTTKNYNNSFIKYLSETYKTATKTKKKDDFSENSLRNATEIVNENENTIENLSSDNSSMSTGYSETDSDLQVKEIDLIPTYIDLQSDSLTHEKPVYYEGGAGKVKITDGGIYIKDELDSTRVKIDSKKGIIANNGIKDTVHIDLNGNASFAGNLSAASGTFDGTITVDSGSSQTIIGQNTINGTTYSIYNENFNIDENGNANFAGVLEAGVDVSQIDNITKFQNLYSESKSYTDGVASHLQAQIDGAIAIYFASGIPTPIEVDYEQATEPSNPSVGELWRDTDNGNYYIFIDNSWTQINEADMTSSPMNWPALPTLSDYESYTGDLFYNNETGYGYRFQYDINRGTPGVSELGDYYWSRISDNAMVAALQAASEAQATADGKMTFFTATSSSEIDGLLVNQTLQEGDVLILSSDITHTTPDPSIVYKANTIYTFSESDNRFYPENKADGSVAGWEINGTDIAAKNGAMKLHSDSDNVGYNPYISIGQDLVGYGNSGIFLGITGETGSGDGNNVFSMYGSNSQEYLNWTGEKLLIKSQNFELDNLGDVTVTGTINAEGGTFNNEIAIGTDTNKISIQGTSSALTTKIYSGAGNYNNIDTGFYIDASGRFSLGDSNSVDGGVSWNGSSLDIKGDLGGTIGAINVGNINITSAGIEAYTDSNHIEDNLAFRLDSGTGGAKFVGTIEAETGKIGALNITSNGFSTVDFTSDNGLYSTIIQPDIVLQSFSASGITRESSLYKGRIELRSYESSTGITSITDVYNDGFAIFDSDFSLINYSGNLKFHSTEELELRSGNANINIQAGFNSTTGYTSTNTANILLEASDRIFLKGAMDEGAVDTVTGNDFIFAYVYGPSNTWGGVVQTNGETVSSKFIKNDIEEVDENNIYQMLEEISFKQYYNELRQDSEMSVIIEDEKQNNTTLSSLFLNNEYTTVTFDELPSWLESSKEELMSKGELIYEKDGSDTRIFLKIPRLELKSYITAAFASAQFNHKRIKKLEQENLQLKKDFEEMKNLMREILNG